MKLTLREWQKTVKSPADILVQAVHPDGSDRSVPFPVGMNHKYVSSMLDLLSLHRDNKLSGSYSALVLMAHNANTDEKRRPQAPNRKSITASLTEKGLLNIELTPINYFSLLPHHKFVISPEGRGIDCHRTYEAIMAGCIPIVEDNAHIREVYAGCPILYTTDYSELTAAGLELTYKEMLDQEWDFSRLFLSYYDEETQNRIKVYTNLGLKFLAGYNEPMYEVSAEAEAAALAGLGEPLWRYVNADQPAPEQTPRPQTPLPQTL